jgi:hypothetical protein
MPKTLAALPSSQYATLLDDVSGQLLVLPRAPWAAAASVVPSTLDAPIAALLRSGWVDFHRTDCVREGWGAEDREVKIDRASGLELRHGLHTNRRRERRGAAVRSCGNAWNMDAIAARGGGKSDGRRCRDFSGGST